VQKGLALGDVCAFRTNLTVDGAFRSIKQRRQAALIRAGACASRNLDRSESDLGRIEWSG